MTDVESHAGSSPAGRRLGITRRLMFSAAAVSLSVLLGLAVGELVLRIGQVLKFPPSLIRLDARRGWVLTPGVHASTPYAKDLAINSRGLRDREFAIPKPADRWRILILGDSFVFGDGVAHRDALPKQLERELGDTHVEVINAGVPGYGTHQEWLLLTDVGLAYEPNLIILGFYKNDLDPYRPRRSRMRTLKNAVKTRLHMYNFARRRVRMLRWRAAGPPPQVPTEVQAALWDGAQAELQRLLDTCRDHGVPLLVTLLGTEDVLGVGARLSTWCATVNIPYFDATAVYEGLDLATVRVSATDEHPNAAGHALAARGLATFLSEQGYPPADDA